MTRKLEIPLPDEIYKEIEVYSKAEGISINVQKPEHGAQLNRSKPHTLTGVRRTLFPKVGCFLTLKLSPL